MDKKWTTKDFPVGLHQLHPDQSVNFQMNRFYNWSNDPEMLEEMKKAGKSIHSYDDYMEMMRTLRKHIFPDWKRLPPPLRQSRTYAVIVTHRYPTCSRR